MNSLVALSCLALSAAPLDVKATFGEEVAKDVDTLKELKAQGNVQGPGRCMKAYMLAVQYERDGNSQAKQQFRICAGTCAQIPISTVEAAKEISKRYATLCREKAGLKEPGAAAAAPGPVSRTKAAGACDSAKPKGSCREFPSFGARTEKDEQKVCEAGQGTWVSGEGCPVHGQIGACVEKATKQVQRWYDAGGNKGMSAAQAKDACSAMGGTFAGPEAAAPAAAPAAGSPGGRPTASDLQSAAAAVAPLVAKKDLAGAEKALTERLGPPQRKSPDAGITSWYSAVLGASCSELRLSDVGGGVPPKVKVIPAGPSECK